MAANSIPRQIFKKFLAPRLDERTYKYLQAGAMGWDIFTKNWWEPELELLSPALRVGETAIDIGANYGLWGYHLGRAVGEHGSVYCFEPLPFTGSTFGLIAKALRFGPQVHLINKGAGEKKGRVTFNVPVTDWGSIAAGLVSMGRKDDRPGKEKYVHYNTKEVACDVVTIDEQLGALEKVALIKSDIEGADLFALRGARKIIEANKPTVIIEITPWYLEGFGLKVADVTGFFDALGYSCYRYETRKLYPAAAKDIVEDNWVFIHPHRRNRFASMLPL